VAPARRLALFDLDGTLTRHDTMFAFVRRIRGTPRLIAGMVLLSPWLAAHRVGLLAADAAKARFLGWFFGGETREQLAAWGAAFADEVDQLLRPGAHDRVEWHRQNGDDVLLVSASLDWWVRPWAERRGLRVLCTEAAYRDGVFAGVLATPNCSGPEKVRRIRAEVRLDEYERVFAYGDSSGDSEMLGLAHEAAYRPFRGG
jgi:HAD superfamily hydrolase (TIGR01490 family)